MKLKFLKENKLWIPNIGIFEPGQVIEINDDIKAKRMLDSKYFKEMKEKKPKEKGSDLDG